MPATVMTLINEFPGVFLLRLGISLLLLAAFVGVSYLLHKYEKINIAQRNLLIVFFTYVVATLYFAVLGRYSKSYYRYEFYIFESYKGLIENFDVSSLLQILINILMFIPVGFLLSAIIKWKYKYFWVIFVSLLLTLSIEALQFVSRCGTFEVDDIFNNLISAILGIVAYACIKPIFIKQFNRKGGFYEYFRRFIQE